MSRLVNPNCLDPESGAPLTDQPTSPEAECGAAPSGKPGVREFKPILDINVGVISSSLGALTANACDGSQNPGVGANDKGRLLTRTKGGSDPSYQGKGFLAWDPTGTKKSPPGDNDIPTFNTKLKDLVVGVDQTGCGYEMPLEATLRFLVDPEPYDTLTREGSVLKKNGVDQTILQQRKDFLRGNSLLAVIILSDENDCSVDTSQQGYLVLGSAPFYKSTSVCDTNPNDKCCTSCALPIPDGCQADGNRCGPNQGSSMAAQWSQVEDHPNLRCFNQKKHYGVSFLYPIQRYVNAFTQVNIDPASRTLEVESGKGVTNPIFSDLSGAGGAIRDPGLVFVAGITGVPWQAIAKRNDQGAPDLNLGFKTYSDLAAESLFDALIGDPDANQEPSDPVMKESVAKRSGQSALTGVSLPGTVGMANGVNGWDRNIPGNDDLQYACIFPLTGGSPNDPDCGAECASDPMCDDPLCDAGDKTQQVNAKAYPGLRELAWLRGMGEQGIFASICPAEVDNKASPIYGYRPAVATIVDRLAEALKGQCLPRQLTPDKEGNVPCLVLEATATGGTGTCDEGAGRRAIAENDPRYNAIKAAQADPLANENWDTFCEIVQLAGDERNECQNNDSPAGINGWCYVDATTAPPTGNPALVESCPEQERRIVRFVGKGEPQTGGTVFITCSGE